MDTILHETQHILLMETPNLQFDKDCAWVEDSVSTSVCLKRQDCVKGCNNANISFSIKRLFRTSGQSQSTHLKLLSKLLLLFTAGGGYLETFASLVLGIKGSLEGAHHFEAVISMITVHKERDSCCTDRQY